jgi:outer membrane lipoprotein-sorting protein
MSVRSALPSCGGERMMRLLTQAGLTTLPLLAVVAVTVSARADSAGAILKKMVDTYSGANAYTATIITHQKGKTKDGKEFSLTKSQSIKYKSPNLVNVVVTFTGEGAAAGKVAQGDQTVVADGKTLTAYSPSRKQYVKKPDLPKLTVLDLLDILKKIPTRDAPNVKLLSSDTVAGRSVNVIQISPMMPPNLTPEQQAKWKEAAAHANPLRLFVDKQNSLLLRIAESANGGSVDVMFENQLFNSSIPASSFTYTPPAGAKEITPPPSALPGGGLSGAPGVKPGITPPPPPAHK